jgi:hypothetical protein
MKMSKANPVLLAAALLASGCLYLPTPKGKILEGTEVKQADLAFLRPAETTKETVVQTLGQPTLFWRDQNILVYRWVKPHGVLLWAVPGGYTVAAGALDVSQECAFLLKFDGKDRYQASQILEKPPLKSYGRFLLEWRESQRTNNWSPQEKTP